MFVIWSQAKPRRRDRQQMLNMSDRTDRQSMTGQWSITNILYKSHFILTLLLLSTFLTTCLLWSYTLRSWLLSVQWINSINICEKKYSDQMLTMQIWQSLWSLKYIKDYDMIGKWAEVCKMIWYNLALTLLYNLNKQMTCWLIYRLI